MKITGGVLAGVALVVASTGFYLLSQDEPGLEARLFDGSVNTLCIELDGQQSINGTISALALIPGTSTSGEVIITHCDVMAPELLDLDVDFRLESTDNGMPSDPPLSEFLIINSFFYGNDDLLATDAKSTVDRNLIDEIDSHPLLGNQDGLLSLAEMQAGVNDLPTPERPPDGTPFWLTVELHPSAGNDLQGDLVDLTMVFRLSDILHGDLN